jgi:Tfp pilus assembly protein PilX
MMSRVLAHPPATHPMPLVRRASTLCLALTAALAACKETTTPPTDLPVGSMQMEVSGDTSFTVRGMAVYASPQSTLTDQSGSQDPELVQLFLETPASPQERRYDGMTAGSTFFVVRGGLIVRQFVSTSGYVDFYEVTAGNVSGNAELSMQEYDLNGQPIPGKRITIDAVFNAGR